MAAAAATYASNHLSWTRSSASVDGSDDEFPGTPAAYEPPSISKKVDLWHRRWKRAKDILDANHIELRRWRTGADVSLDAVALVERNLRDLSVDGSSDSNKEYKR